LDFAGSVHFVTAVTRAPGEWFVDAPMCRAVLKVFEGYRAKFRLECFGYVLMPDHLHVLMCQMEDGPLVSQLMEGFKSVTSRSCRPLGYPMPTLWKDRYDDVPVPGSKAAATKLRYMWENPVRRGLVSAGENYVWSSAADLTGRGSGIVMLSPI
jgi:putative transposase